MERLKMGPASDRRVEQTEKTLLEVLALEVKWLQEKFGELLKQQQSILLTMSDMLDRVAMLENKPPASLVETEILK
jgi:hypothetical protein